MQQNVGGYERITRLVVGTALLVFGVGGVALLSTGAGAFGTESVALAVATGVFLLVGSTLVVTGYLQQCPINSHLGIDSLYVDRI